MFAHSVGICTYKTKATTACHLCGSHPLLSHPRLSTRLLQWPLNSSLLLFLFFYGLFSGLYFRKMPFIISLLSYTLSHDFSSHPDRICSHSDLLVDTHLWSPVASRTVSVLSHSNFISPHYLLFGIVAKIPYQLLQEGSSIHRCSRDCLQFGTELSRSCVPIPGRGERNKLLPPTEAFLLCIPATMSHRFLEIGERPPKIPPVSLKKESQIGLAVLTSVSRIRTLVCDFWFWALTLASCSCRPWEAVVMIRVIGFLPLTREEDLSWVPGWL